MTTMVDSKIGRTFQRSMGRAKEKLLQNLGKVDRTADEILDEQIGNFTKQQGAATRLQKELNNYIRCIRACAAASRSLLEAVGEVYEPEWGGKELLSVNAQSSELLWNDFAHRLAEQVLIPLNTYQGQFPEMRKKIEKRARKLIDFDGERHALQALQSNPRRAEAKLAKQRESLEAAKRTYEVLNMELHEELPSLYNSRIVFLVSAMSTLFASENIFHGETSKVYTELEGIVERLAKESAKGNLNFKPSNAIMNHTMGGDSSKEDMKVNGERSTSTSPVNNTTTSSNSKPSSPVTPTSRPTSLNITATATTNGDGEHLTPNTAKMVDSAVDASNHVAMNGDATKHHNNTTTPISTATPEKMHTTENGVDSHDSAMPETKVVNGEGSVVKEGETTESKVEPVEKMVNGDADHGPTNNKHVDNMNDNNVVTMMNGGDEDKKDVKENGESMVEEKQRNGHVHDDDDENKKVVESPRRTKNADASNKVHDDAKHVNGNGNANGELPDEPSPSKEKVSGGDAKEPGVLYRVRATYRYQKEDVDELSFEAGEIIRVIEYDEPEEQEEGWLMGIKENGEKGLFPANFTRPI